MLQVCTGDAFDLAVALKKQGGVICIERKTYPLGHFQAVTLLTGQRTYEFMSYFIIIYLMNGHPFARAYLSTEFLSVKLELFSLRLKISQIFIPMKGSG